MNPKMYNKRILLALLACLGTLTLWAAPSKTFTKTVKMNPGGTLMLDTFKGEIRIEPWDKNQVQIEAVITADMNHEVVDAEYAQKTVDKTHIDVHSRGDLVTVVSNYDKVPSKSKSNFFGLSTSSIKILPFVNYVIRAPRQASIELDDYKSKIWINGFEGEHSLESYKGELDVRDLTGSLDLETYKGAAKVVNLSGKARLETYKGDIEMSAKRLDGDCRFETYKGTIEANLPDNVAYNLSSDVGKKGTLDNSLKKPQRLSPAGLRVKTYKGIVRLGNR